MCIKICLETCFLLMCSVEALNIFISVRIVRCRKAVENLSVCWGCWEVTGTSGTGLGGSSMNQEFPMGYTGRFFYFFIILIYI